MNYQLRYAKFPNNSRTLASFNKRGRKTPRRFTGGRYFWRLAGLPTSNEYIWGFHPGHVELAVNFPSGQLDMKMNWSDMRLTVELVYADEASRHCPQEVMEYFRALWMAGGQSAGVLDRLYNLSESTETTDNGANVKQSAQQSNVVASSAASDKRCDYAMAATAVTPVQTGVDPAVTAFASTVAGSFSNVTVSVLAANFPVPAVADSVLTVADPVLLVAASDSVTVSVPAVAAAVPAVTASFPAVDIPVPAVADPVLTVADPVLLVAASDSMVTVSVPTVAAPVPAVAASVPVVTTSVSTVADSVPTVTASVLAVDIPVPDVADPVLTVADPVLLVAASKSAVTVSVPAVAAAVPAVVAPVPDVATVPLSAVERRTSQPISVSAEAAPRHHPVNADRCSVQRPIQSPDPLAVQPSGPTWPFHVNAASMQAAPQNYPNFAGALPPYQPLPMQPWPIQLMPVQHNTLLQMQPVAAPIRFVPGPNATPIQFIPVHDSEDPDNLVCTIFCDVNRPPKSVRVVLNVPAPFAIGYPKVFDYYIQMRPPDQTDEVSSSDCGPEVGRMISNEN